jgi:hypothetical protein
MGGETKKIPMLLLVVYGEWFCLVRIKWVNIVLIYIAVEHCIFIRSAQLSDKSRPFRVYDDVSI